MQQLDIRLDALRHQLDTIPEVARLRELATKRHETEGRERDLRVEVSDLTDEQKKADRDVEAVKTRRERDQQMLDSGAVTNPKDAERMLHELESLARRISDLEDVEIEVMERLEEAQASLQNASHDLTEIDEQAAVLAKARDERAGDVQRQLDEASAEREQTVVEVPEDLLALYTKLREQKGGVGAAALRAKQCEGCRLTLDASILRDIAIAPADDVLRCEECGRILVRTAESGL